MGNSHQVEAAFANRGSDQHFAGRRRRRGEGQAVGGTAGVFGSAKPPGQLSVAGLEGEQAILAVDHLAGAQEAGLRTVVEHHDERQPAGIRLVGAQAPGSQVAGARLGLVGILVAELGLGVGGLVWFVEDVGPASLAGTAVECKEAVRLANEDVLSVGDELQGRVQAAGSRAADFADIYRERPQQSSGPGGV